MFRDRLQPTLASNRRLILIFSALILLTLPIYVQGHFLHTLILVLIFGLFAASLDLIWGYTGVLSFGHAVFFGIGGYVAAFMIKDVSPTPIIYLPLAFTIGALLAILMLYPAVQAETTGIYLAVITLIYSLLFEILGVNFQDITGGYTGISGIPWPTLTVGAFGGVEISGEIRYYYFVIFTVAVSIYILKLLVDSAYGRVFRAIRENRSRTLAIGYNPKKYMTVSLAISGGFASLAGALYSPFASIIAPQIFGFNLSGRAILFVLLGGRGTLIGAFIGTFAIRVPETFISSLLPGVWTFVIGTLFIIFVLYFPDGITSIISKYYKEYVKYLK